MKGCRVLVSVPGITTTWVQKATTVSRARKHSVRSARAPQTYTFPVDRSSSSSNLLPEDSPTISTQNTMGLHSLFHRRRSFARRRVGVVGAGAATIVLLLHLVLAVFVAKSSAAVEESGYIGKFDRDRPEKRSIRRRNTGGDSRRHRYTSRGQNRRGSLRRLLSDDDDDDDGAAAVAAAATRTTDEDKKKKECDTALDIIESSPELTRLRDAISDLPDVRAALGDREATDTFFAPTDDACFGFTRWAGFNATEEGGGRTVCVLSRHVQA